MKVFAFDPADHAEQYRAQGWAHIKNGVDPEFLAVLQAFAEEQFGTHVVEGRGIAGTKQQALYEFPAEVEFPGHLFDVIAAVGGLRRESMTLSERHIKAYDADTPVEVPAHKDRLSSQISVGLSILIPEGSALVAYPEVDVWANPFNVSASLRESLAEDELPENLLQGKPEVVIHDEPGDVMMFPGASVWHKRRQAAGAVNLYLKFNDFESDPLGEDPETPRRRERTLAALTNGQLGSLRAVASRRLDTITIQRARDGSEYRQADVWGEPKVRLSDLDSAFLDAMDGSRSVETLRGELGSEIDEAVRRLAERGVIDLV